MGADDHLQEEEVTLIVVDSCVFISRIKGFKENQIKAIELYCRAKLKSNPKNAIGLYAPVSPVFRGSYLQPTSDVDKILAHLHQGIKYGGTLKLSTGIAFSLSFNRDRYYRDFKHKRLLFFVGSPSCITVRETTTAGHIAYQMGLAVDVLNFCPVDAHNHCKTALTNFVAAADNNGNSHIINLPNVSSLPVICNALSSLSSPPIITRALMEQVEIAAAAAAAAREKIAKENAYQMREMLPLLRKEMCQVAHAPPPAEKAKLAKKKIWVPKLRLDVPC